MTESSSILNRRKGAVKEKNVLLVKGHQMCRHYFTSFTSCCHCTLFIWGVVSYQGYRCKVCQLACHTHCCDYLSIPCMGSDVNIFSNDANMHEFKTFHLVTPKYCSHCGSIIGLGRRGLKCNKCPIIIHQKCKSLVMNTCGISLTETRGRICLSLKVTGDPTNNKALVTATMHECRNLPPMDPNGNADPYVVMSFENRKVKTKVISKTKNPTWEHEMTLEISLKNLGARLRIDVWDKDICSPDDHIGSMSFSVQELLEFLKEPDKYPFIKKGWFKLLREAEGKLMYSPIIEDPHIFKESAFTEATKDSTTPVASGSKFTMSQFREIKVIGRGSFGKVVLVTLVSNKEVFAMKMLRKDALVMDDDTECAVLEREVMSLANPPYFLVKLFCSFQTFERLCFVMEYVPGGDLMHRLQAIYRFKEDHARFYLAELSEALCFLHSYKVVHRDIKPENVMMDRLGHIKLADFGMAKKGVDGDHMANTFCGTPEYIAPEIIARSEYGKSVDWWSYGILGYHMIKGSPPFMTDDDSALFAMILQAEIKYPNWFSPGILTFLKKLLKKNPAERLGSGEDGSKMLQGDEFFAQIDFEKLRNMGIEPPYRPKIKSVFDCSNFDPDFTSETLKPSKTDKMVVMNYKGSDFQNFSYINHEYPVDI